MRLPLAALQQLLRDSAATLRESLVVDANGGEEAGRWCGLRAWLVDGSSTITPDVPGLQKAFLLCSNFLPRKLVLMRISEQPACRH